jgi:hypothetical protein
MPIDCEIDLSGIFRGTGRASRLRPWRQSVRYLILAICCRICSLEGRFL